MRGMIRALLCCLMALAAVPAGAWSHPTIDVGGTQRRLDELVPRRWQELEIHLVDLGIGITHRDWPDDFVAFWLPRVRPNLAGRLPGAATAPVAAGRALPAGPWTQGSRNWRASMPRMPPAARPIRMIPAPAKSPMPLGHAWLRTT